MLLALSLPGLSPRLVAQSGQGAAHQPCEDLYFAGGNITLASGVVSTSHSIAGMPR